MKTAHTFQVGDAVAVKLYAAAPGQDAAEPFTGGFTVRSVEYEDVTVERSGHALSMPAYRVKAA